MQARPLLADRVFDRRQNRIARLAVFAFGIALSGGAAVAGDDLPSDADAIWTVRVENDSISTFPHGSDQNYTAGQQFGWTSGLNAVPDVVASVADSIWGDGGVRLGLGLTQQIYTPVDKVRAVPNPLDRPYAGYLAATGSLMHDGANARDLIALSLGVIGPLAQGERAQNGVHGLIRDAKAQGWSYQLPNEAAVEVFGQRTWRIPVGQMAGLESDALPALALGLGTVRDYAQAALVLRVGQGLDVDYGASRIRPGISGGDAFADRDAISWYGFVGVNGQAVARDAFLDGDLFTASAHVRRNPLVGEGEVGLAVIWRGMRLSYVQTWQTAEFRHQSPAYFSFGSVALSVRF